MSKEFTKDKTIKHKSNDSHYGDIVKPKRDKRRERQSSKRDVLRQVDRFYYGTEEEEDDFE